MNKVYCMLCFTASEFLTSDTRICVHVYPVELYTLRLLFDVYSTLVFYVFIFGNENLFYNSNKPKMLSYRYMLCSLHAGQCTGINCKIKFNLCIHWQVIIFFLVDKSKREHETTYSCMQNGVCRLGCLS